MAELTEWKVPASAQPRIEDYSYDLEGALTSIVGLHSIIPADAFTAQLLPAAATNEWTLELSPDKKVLSYILKRNGKLRFQADFKLQ